MADSSPVEDRFTIRANRWMAINLAALFGATAKRRFLQVTDKDLVIRFGWGIRHHFPLKTIQRAGRTLTGGPGWGPTPMAEFKPEVIRSWTYSATIYNSGDEHLAMAFSGEGLVKVQLYEPTKVRLWYPRVTVREMTFSLEEPERFLAALRRAGVHIDPSTQPLPAGEQDPLRM